MLNEIPLPPDLPLTRLGDLLPYDDPDSPWLYRLMVLRDDLDFELRSLALDSDAEPIRTWDTLYFLRRVSVSVDEIKNIWARYVGHAVKRWKLEPKPKAELTRIGKIVIETAKKLENVRNALGGHVRLSNADRSKPRRRSRPKRWLYRLCRRWPDLEEDEFERKMLGQFADWRGPALLDTETGRATNFRGLTVTALLVVSQTDEIQKLVTWHEDLRLLEACGDILHGIDYLVHIKAAARSLLVGRPVLPLGSAAASERS